MGPHRNAQRSPSEQARAAGAHDAGAQETGGQANGSEPAPKKRLRRAPFHNSQVVDRKAYKRGDERVGPTPAGVEPNALKDKSAHETWERVFMA